MRQAYLSILKDFDPSIKKYMNIYDVERRGLLVRVTISVLNPIVASELKPRAVNPGTGKFLSSVCGTVMYNLDVIFYPGRKTHFWCSVTHINANASALRKSKKERQRPFCLLFQYGDAHAR